MAIAAAPARDVKTFKPDIPPERVPTRFRAEFQQTVSSCRSITAIKVEECVRAGTQVHRIMP